MARRMFLLVVLLGLGYTTLAQSPDPANRLPIHITPTNYAIHLEPDMDSSTVTGSVDITFNTSSDLSVPITSVVMHLGSDVFVDELSVSLMEFTGQMKPIGAIEYDDPHTLIKVVLTDGDALQHSQTYIVSLHFTSILYSEPTGLFTGFINSTSRYIASNFRPTFARNVFPCFDEPHFKTPVRLEVLRPSTYTAVSTALLKTSTKSKENGKVLDTFMATPPISIHSLGLFISQLSSVNSPMGVKLYAPSGSPEYVPFLDTLFSNIITVVGQFPIAPLKLVVLPDQLKMYLASYSFLFISSDLYNYKEDKPSFSAHDWSFLRLQVTEALLRQFLEFSKTPSWWSDLWLSESVGAYFAAYIQPEVLPWLEVETRSDVLGMDCDNQRPPVINLMNESHWAIEKAVSSQSIRNKGFGVLNMWSNTLPEGVVFWTIAEFMKLDKSIMTTEDFLEILVNNIKANKTYDVTPAIAGLPTWLNASGFPIITYMEQPDNTFQLIQRPENSSANSVWPVSISFIQNNSQDWDHYRWGLWLLNSSSSFSPKGFSENKWTVLNLESGLYRVDYDKSWVKILDALKTDLVPLRTPDVIKASIQDDAVALSLQDDLPFSTAFEVLTSTQRYMLDWLPVAKAFEVFSNKIGNDNEIYDNYRDFAASLFSKELLADLDLNNKPAVPRIQYIRSIMTPWLCQFNIGNFREAASNLFDKILEGDLDKVDPGDVENVACYGVQYNNSILPSLISGYVASSDLQLKHLYTIGLGCVTDPPSVERVLNLVVNLTSPIAKSDAKKIIVSLASRIANSDIILDFISQQAPTIQLQLGCGCLGDVLQTLGKLRIDMSKIERLTNDPSMDPFIIHSALHAIKRTNASLAWWSVNALKLEEALPQKHHKTTTTTTTTTASPSPSASVSSSTPLSTTTVEITTTTTTTPATPITTAGATSTIAPATITSAGTTLETTTGAANGTTAASANGTTSFTTVTKPPPTQVTTPAPPRSTSAPSSCTELIPNIKIFVLILSLPTILFSTKL